MLSRVATAAPMKLAFSNQIQRDLFKYVVMRELQKRNYQTAYKPGVKTSVFDSLSLVYEDPKYSLDLKPLEFRDQQYNSYTGFGSIAVIIPSAIAFFICFFSLAWYTAFDTDVVFTRHNWHPFFDIHSGKDTDRTKNPLFQWTWAFGYGSAVNFDNSRVFFYNEIEQAIKNRKQQLAATKKQ